jgi:hypothetical protein
LTNNEFDASSACAELWEIAEPSAVNSEMVALSTEGFATRFTEGIPLSTDRIVVTASFATVASLKG